MPSILGEKNSLHLAAIGVRPNPQSSLTGLLRLACRQPLFLPSGLLMQNEVQRSGPMFSGWCFERLDRPRAALGFSNKSGRVQPRAQVGNGTHGHAAALLPEQIR